MPLKNWRLANPKTSGHSAGNCLQSHLQCRFLKQAQLTFQYVPHFQTTAKFLN